MSTADYHAWTVTAVTLAQQAGELARQKLAAPLERTSKGFRDLVTNADLAAQMLITSAIQQQYPHHAFLAEENDTTLPSTGSVHWVIDPIDGTSNFSRQLPIFCTSIAAVHNDQVVAAAIYDPMRQELFQATLGQPSLLNNQPIRVNNNTDLATSMSACDWSRDANNRTTMHKIHASLIHKVTNIRAFGSATLSLAWIAAGRLDFYFNPRLSPWDFAAAQLILTNAGGTLTTWNNDTPSLSSPCRILASNNHFHATLLSEFAPYC
ncbi:MAG TPA: inositol monophosphatase [Anaerolineae bacterium]|nr:inositol monophosphatase [Anaerolineae bacterium]